MYTAATVIRMTSGAKAAIAVVVIIIGLVAVAFAIRL